MRNENSDIAENETDRKGLGDMGMKQKETKG
jgi:hypothetical protein